MTHEKILKRADGSRVRVTVTLVVNWTETRWTVIVERCAKKSRKWICPRLPKEYYNARTPEAAARKMKRDAKLAWASQDEIESVMRELIEQIKPVF